MTTMKHTGTQDFTGATVVGLAAGGSAVTIDADGTLVVDGTTVEVATDAQLTAGLAAKLDTSAAVPLAASGQTPAQEPVSPGAAAVGTLAQAARADHVHPSSGLFAVFGSGAHGAAVFDGSSAVTGCARSGVVYTAQSDLHYTSVSFSTGVTLNMDGWRLYVRGVLSCPSGSATITVTPLAASGTNGSAPGGLTATATYGGGFGRARTLGPAVRGAAGAVGVGVAPSTLYSGNIALSPVSGASGNGGAGGSGAGGPGGSHGQNSWDVANALSAPPLVFCGLAYSYDTANSWNASGNASMFGPLHGGRGGGSGAGDGTNPGGAGGCGGNVVLVNAKSIVGTVNITAPGGAGGTPTTGNCGGGGGGTGGTVVVNTLDSASWTGTASAAAGAAGSGVGTGTAGTAGAAGYALATTWQ